MKTMQCNTCSAQGFTDWKHTFMGDSKKSVPDSCCLFEVPGCGQNLFEITDIRVIVQKININGRYHQRVSKCQDKIFQVACS